MDEQFLKHTAINSVVLLLVVCIISIFISQNSESLIYADSRDEINMDDSQKQVDEGSNLEENNPSSPGLNEIYNKLGDKYLIIKKPQAIDYKVNLIDLYMDRAIQIDIVGEQGTIFDDNSFYRVNNGIEYSGKSSENINEINPKKDQAVETFNNSNIRILNEKNNLQTDLDNSDTFHVINPHLEMLLVPQVLSASGLISNYDNNYVQKPIIDPVISYEIKTNEIMNTNESMTTFYVVLDDIYAHMVYQDDVYIYIDLRRPKDVYDKIIVIDAGHGGKDSGTNSRNEEYYEKDINLKILLYLKELLDKTNYKVYYTRTSDKTLFLNPRVNFANDVEADLFISVHCNASESPLPYGSEVLYNELHESDVFSSKDLATLCLEEITNITQRVNRGLVEASEMVIIGKSKVPVAIVEIAFMSNSQDLEFLLQESNQKEIANSLYRVIERAYEVIGK